MLPSRIAGKDTRALLPETLRVRNKGFAGGRSKADVFRPEVSHG